MIAMSRSFEVVAESPDSVEQIHAAFSREDYWLARLAGDASVTLDSLILDPDGTVAVQITQRLGRQLLPGLVAKVVPGDLGLQYRETWQPVDNGHMRGEVTVLASGGLGSTRSKNLVAPSGSGSQLRCAVNVEVKIPLVGGKLEQFLGANLADSLPTVLSFTTGWLAEHG